MDERHRPTFTRRLDGIEGYAGVRLRVSQGAAAPGLDNVLRRLKHRADIVLVDAPAMLAVSDAINLTPKVDAGSC